VGWQVARVGWARQVLSDLPAPPALPAWPAL